MSSDEPSPYAGTSPVASLASTEGVVTLVEGQTFALSGRSGDMAADFPQGLFVHDRRVLSQWELRLNGHRLEPLAVDLTAPFGARFVGRGAPVDGHADADVVVFRHRHVGRGMRERIVVVNHGLRPAGFQLELTCDADFAGVFEVKDNRVERRGEHRSSITPTDLTFTHHDTDLERSVRVTPSAAPTIGHGLVAWKGTLEPGATWETCVGVTVVIDETDLEPLFSCGGRDLDSLPQQRMASWRATLPVVASDDDSLSEAITRSAEDLGALRIFDPDHPELPILAAGAPWFMTVFGRDSLLTAWMTLLADPSLAHGVLETLARFQGTEERPDIEEQPGKILHEMRFGTSAVLALGGGSIYYGSVDATPLFVMLLGELRRWDARSDLVDRLLPHADRALAWIEEYGDRDGDGYVEYQRTTEHGLANQGWKDSWDAIRHADGRLAEAPIALCEVQGYVYAAYVARAQIARDAGDHSTFERYRAKAVDLRRRFNEDFWLDERRGFALALDADKQPVEVATSNVGHCLWTEIVDVDRARTVAAQLSGPDLFTGFGVRTLSAAAAAYNPVSYHNGSVWPHDNAIVAAGLARYGFVEEALRIISAQIDVARCHHGRLPELFAGFDRGELSVPASYPTSCSPQAWAAAAPLLWLRTLLRFDPWATGGTVWLDPHLPAGIAELTVSGISVADQELTVAVDRREIRVEGAGDLEVVLEPRPPASLLDPLPR